MRFDRWMKIRLLLISAWLEAIKDLNEEEVVRAIEANPAKWQMLLARNLRDISLVIIRERTVTPETEGIQASSTLESPK